MKLSLTKIFLIILIVLFAVNISQAGPRKKLGTSAAPELLIPVGSVGTSLSGTNMAYVTGIDAMYWNPAGLSKLDANSAEVMFSHMKYIADINLEYLSAAAKLGNLGTIGIGIKSMSLGEFEKTTELQPDGSGQYYKPTFIVANLSLARQMTDRIRFGTNVKLVNNNIADVSATGVCFDFGIQYKGGESGFNFGIAIKNLGPSMRFNGPGLDKQVEQQNGQIVTERVVLQDFDMPTALDVGVAYTFVLKDKQKKDMMDFTLSAGFMNNSFTSDEYKFGLEYNYKKIFYLRGALSIAPDSESGERLWGPTFGAGLKYPFGSVTIGFDYAYRFVQESAFNSTNQFFTISLGF